jgi:hypothetical protein
VLTVEQSVEVRQMVGRGLPETPLPASERAVEGVEEGEAVPLPRIMEVLPDVVLAGIDKMEYRELLMADSVVWLLGVVKGQESQLGWRKQ